MYLRLLGAGKVAGKPISGTDSNIEGLSRWEWLTAMAVFPLDRPYFPVKLLENIVYRTK